MLHQAGAGEVVGEGVGEDIRAEGEGAGEVLVAEQVELQGELQKHHNPMQ